MWRRPALLGSGLLLALAGCASGSPTPAPSSAGTASATGSARAATALTWVVNRAALADLESGGMSNNQLSELFNNARTYIVGEANTAAESADISNWISPRSVTVTDLRPAGFARGAAAVLYDDEDWPLTPKAQQRNPGEYEAEGYRLARARGVVFIAAPAMDLVRVLDPDGTGTVAQRFLSLDLIGQAARDADIVDIQAQGLEGSAQYTSFVLAAAKQAKAANPAVKVLAGLSTNPSGRAIAASVLAEDADSVRGAVDGYWLNIPSGGTACPSCGTARPQAAVPWLEQLLRG
ncbi:hypothetical protein KDK95_29280 [Actinospica sp. MGRD01-02]|uniref:Uncharacterized protein n=1 Tax=Actinospica acidithermotolerans TaxID=2828514 RepID=A0A941IKC7_9ACTN|nr:hypothetical protein [Actinospica acidithermotolerans]MBR7830429.1 hypothetical protein [Actinospica acidithermotolerans]